MRAMRWVQQWDRLLPRIHSSRWITLNSKSYPSRFCNFLACKQNKKEKMKKETLTIALPMLEAPFKTYRFPRSQWRSNWLFHSSPVSPVLGEYISGWIVFTLRSGAINIWVPLPLSPSSTQLAASRKGVSRLSSLLEMNIHLWECF